MYSSPCHPLFEPWRPETTSGIVSNRQRPRSASVVTPRHQHPSPERPPEGARQSSNRRPLGSRRGHKVRRLGVKVGSSRLRSWERPAIRGMSRLLGRVDPPFTAAVRPCGQRPSRSFFLSRASDLAPSRGGWLGKRRGRESSLVALEEGRADRRVCSDIHSSAYTSG